MIGRIGTALMGGILGAMVPLSAQEASTTVAIRHVTVIDATGSAPLADATVLIRGARIEAVGPTGRIPIPAGATVVEGEGKFLVPGLIDTHLHIARRVGAPMVDRQLGYALANGVTGFREASGIGKERELVSLRERIERGELLAPRLYISGTASGQNIPRYQASGLADLVRRLRDVGVDGIKLRNLTQPQADTAIRAAKEAGLAVFGHTYGPGTDVDFTVPALEAGATGVMHINGPGPASTVKPRTVLATGWQGEWLRLHFRWVDATVADEARLVQALVNHGAWLEPTLTTVEFEVHGEQYEDRPESRVAEILWEYPFSKMREGMPAWAGSDREVALEGYARMQNFVRRAHQAGIPIIAGTDGYPQSTGSIHEELRLLVAAGLSPMAALQAATRNAARALGWEKRTGTIVAGLDADLVLLEANPLDDISNTKRIALVIRAGRVLDREELNRLAAVTSP